MRDVQEEEFESSGDEGGTWGGGGEGREVRKHQMKQVFKEEGLP